MILLYTTILSFCLCSFASGKVIRDNSCGGHIEAILDETIFLEYKPDEQYDNDELCVWEIRVNEFLGVLFRKTQSGFEVGYDYLQISAISDNLGNVPSAVILGNTPGFEEGSARGSIVFLIFTSDYSNTGTGFKIEITGFERSPFKPRVYDDFISYEPTGSVTLRPYLHDMTQSYLIIPKHGTLSSLILNVDYATEWYDYIYVYTLERNGQIINFKLQARRLSEIGSNTFVAEYYANFIVLFYSNANDITDNGGFTLSWYGEEYYSTTEIYS